MSVITEAGKLAAFVRRDFRIALSHRMGALSGLVGIVVQVVAVSAIVLTDLRAALIGTAGWHALAMQLIELVPLAIASVVAGIFFFRFFLRRERRLGTLGLY